MTENSRLLDALLTAGTIALFFAGACYVAYRVVRWARRQSKGAYVLGAALAPFMAMGHVLDPEFRIVHEAKQLKKREEDNPGDPPDGEDDRIALGETRVTRAPDGGGSEAAAGRRKVTRPAVSRPLLARAIAIVLGVMAVATSAVASLSLFSGFYGAAVRASFSLVEWLSVYLMSALLLAAMFQLFRLKKASVWLFSTYLCVGVLLSLGQWLAREPSSSLDLRMALFTVPLALAVLAYLRRLRTQGTLV